MNGYITQYWVTYKRILISIGIVLGLAACFGGYKLAEKEMYSPLEVVRAETLGEMKDQPELESTARGKNEQDIPTKAAEKTVLVQVAGSVKEPGIYTMNEGQRVSDAIEAAGGATGEIDIDAVNLVMKLRDGQKINVKVKSTGNLRTGAGAKTDADTESKPGVESKPDVESEPGAGSMPGTEPRSAVEPPSSEKPEAKPGPDAGAMTEKEAVSGTGVGPGEKININTAPLQELTRLPGIGEYYAGRIVEYRDREGLFEKVEDIKNVPGIGDKRYDQMKAYITVK